MSLLVVTSECMKACNASNALICPPACIEDGILGMLTAGAMAMFLMPPLPVGYNSRLH
jgi:hypothetical protein